MSDHPIPQLAAWLPALRPPAYRELRGGLAHAIHVIVTRRHLRHLEPRLLADIGLTRSQALAEAARPPWDLAPAERENLRLGNRQPSREWPPQPPRHNLLVGRVRRAWRVWQSRRRIATLDARLLKDIGVSYAEAEQEANKPFWR
jgi:uncharacterized protein YjiS (DUF1127 family)